MVAASLQMSWSLHNEIKDFYCATFDLPSNYFVIWVRIKNRLTIGPYVYDFCFINFYCLQFTTLRLPLSRPIPISDS